jgi:hypothetical protein
MIFWPLKLSLFKGRVIGRNILNDSTGDEDAGGTLLRNISSDIPDYTASHTFTLFLTPTDPLRAI